MALCHCLTLLEVVDQVVVLTHLETEERVEQEVMLLVVVVVVHHNSATLVLAAMVETVS
jgi:hypothetical protein